jgi:uncharacterized membrane protein required for colicin V production
MEPLLIDILAAAVLLIALWRGYKKGIVLTLCGFLAIFVALIGATVVSNALAEPVASAIEPVVETRLQDIIERSYQSASSAVAKSSGSEDGEDKDPLADMRMKDILNALQDSKLYHSLAQAFQTAVDKGVVQVTTTVAKTLAHYIAVQLARKVLFGVAFVVVLVGWQLLSRALDLVSRLPVLYTVNHWFGGVVGLAQGCLIVFIAVWLLKDSFLPEETVKNTYLLRFLDGISPFSVFS